MHERFVIASFAALAFSSLGCASALPPESFASLWEKAPAAGDASTARICHRVVEQRTRVKVYCGSPEKWADLQARVDLRCHTLTRTAELCATAAEWKRVNLAALTSAPVMSGSRPVYGEAQASTEMNHPTVTFSGTPIPGK